jgi:hypothetical protein
MEYRLRPDSTSKSQRKGNMCLNLYMIDVYTGQKPSSGIDTQLNELARDVVELRRPIMQVFLLFPLGL